MRGKEKSLRARIEELEKENAGLIGSLASAWQCGSDMAIKASARIAELEATITAATIILAEIGVPSEDKNADAFNVLTAGISSAALKGEK